MPVAQLPADGKVSVQTGDRVREAPLHPMEFSEVVEYLALAEAVILLTE
jgi:hypothetical protein